MMFLLLTFLYFGPCYYTGPHIIRLFIHSCLFSFMRPPNDSVWCDCCLNSPPSPPCRQSFHNVPCELMRHWTSCEMGCPVPCFTTSFAKRPGKIPRSRVAICHHICPYWLREFNWMLLQSHAHVHTLLMETESPVACP